MTDLVAVGMNDNAVVHRERSCTDVWVEFQVLTERAIQPLNLINTDIEGNNITQPLTK